MTDMYKRNAMCRSDYIKCVYYSSLFANCVIHCMSLTSKPGKSFTCNNISEMCVDIIMENCIRISRLEYFRSRKI